MPQLEVKVLHEALPHTAREWVRTVISIAHRNQSMVFVFKSWKADLFQDKWIAACHPLWLWRMTLEIISVVCLCCSPMKLYSSYSSVGFSEGVSYVIRRLRIFLLVSWLTFIKLAQVIYSVNFLHRQFPSNRSRFLSGCTF